MVKIRNIDLKYVLSDLKAPFKTALREIATIESIYVFIYTTDGNVGVGEAVPTHAITGDTVLGIVAAIRVIERQLVGANLDPELLVVIQKAIVGNTSAKAALDMAIYDLLAKSKQLPLYRYLQSTYQTLETSHTVSLNDVETMVNDAKYYTSLGFKSLKVKLGDNVALDQLRIREIHHAVPSMNLSIDANQGWSESDALNMIAFLNKQKVPIEVIEQPVLRKQYEVMKRIHQKSHIPIMADESLFDVYDAHMLNACGIHLFNIKLMKSGGIFPGLSIANVAMAHHGACMVGSMMETHVSLTAAFHFALSIQAYKVDFDAPFMLKEKVVSGGIQYHVHHVDLEDKEAFGLGIDHVKLMEVCCDAKSL